MKFEPEQESKAIDLCRLPLALAVIFIHLNMMQNATMVNWAHLGSMDVYRLVECAVTNELAAIAVPLFFLISGYLFFYRVPNFNLGVYTSKIKRRFFSLFVPYVVFNVLAIAGLLFKYTLVNHNFMKSCQQLLGDGKWCLNLWCARIYHATNIAGFEMYSGFPINVPLWFVRDLMVVSVLSPLVYWGVKKGKGWLVALMAVLYVLNIWIPFVGFGAVTWFFFALGAFLSLNGKGMANAFFRLRWPLFLAFLTLFVLDFYTDGSKVDAYVHRSFLLAAVPTAFNVVLWLTGNRNRNVPKWVGQAAFFVFAIHTLPLPFPYHYPFMLRPVEFFKTNLWTNSSNGFVCIGEFFLMWLGVAAFCLAIFFLMKKLCPSALNFLTGKR